MIFASRTKRLLAFAIDTMALVGIYMAFGLIVALIPLLGSLLLSLPMVAFWFYGGLIGVGWLYYALSESSSKGATFGKQILGLKVVRTTGESISFARASARFFSRALLRIGVILIFFTKKRQALHDKIASTVIIQL